MKIITIENPGREYEVIGLVEGNSARAANALKDTMAGVRDFFGGKSKSYNAIMSDLLRDVYTDISTKAADAGADAVVGFRTQSIALGGSKMVALQGLGTAIRYKP